MTPNIISKLRELLNAGIKKEIEGVYLLAAIRKILEQEDEKARFKYLNFHCNWALHAKLGGRDAQEILKQFNDANIILRDGMELGNLPNLLRTEIDEISKMQYFRSELLQFLQEKGLPTLDWVSFLSVYARVIEDCPLVVNGDNADTITHVTVKIELADELIGNWQPFQIRWIIVDKNGLSGEIFVINSFNLTETTPI